MDRKEKEKKKEEERGTPKRKEDGVRWDEKRWV